MPSEIKQLRPNQAPASNANGRAQNADRASVSGAGKPNADRTAADTVTVTGEASRLQQLEQVANSGPSVDAKRVAELRQAIADGSYRPNAERIADKMMQLESELG